MGIQEEDKIMDQFERLERLGIEKVDIVTSFHSMTFIYESENSVQSFVNVVSRILKKRGIFACMAMDGRVIHRELGKYRQISVDGIKIQRSEDNPRKIMVKLATVDDTLAEGQTEYLVDFDHLISRMEAAGFEMLTKYDDHLKAEAPLNDSELWWSQMTRVIVMRYIGFNDTKTAQKDKPMSERLKQLLTIMQKALHLTQLAPDVIEPFPQESINFLSGINVGTKLSTVGVLAGGSCFIHAILWAINKEYRDMKLADERIAMVTRIRFELSANFTRDIYKTLGFGNIKELGHDVGAFSYETLQDDLMKYTHWFGLEFLEFVTSQLNINIHLVWWVNDKLEIYKHASVKETLFVKTRNNIILYWEGENHFQPVGKIKDNDNLSFVFSSQDNLIKNMIS